jgi:hypothetical protein
MDGQFYTSKFKFQIKKGMFTEYVHQNVIIYQKSE